MKNSPETLRKRQLKKQYLRETIDRSSFPKYIKKVCKDCKKRKDCRWSCDFTAKGVPIYRARCDKCHYAWMNPKRRTPQNRRRKALAVRKRNRKIKQKCIEYLGGKCIKCGYDKCIRALTFNHKNRKEKEYNLSQIKDRRWELIQTELDKCELVCFNCHMEYEHDYDSEQEKLLEFTVEEEANAV